MMVSSVLHGRRVAFRWLLALVCALVIQPQDALAQATAQKFPNVLSASVRAAGENAYDFDVTISSPYDTASRYADAFRVVGKDGVVFAERVLLHDHASEQPFTRDLYGVRVPPRVQSVVVQARDKQFGYGGRTVEVLLPGR